MSYLFAYSIWNIVFDEIDTSKWACRYCILNQKDEAKHLIKNESHAALYCGLFKKDPEIEELIKSKDELKIYDYMVNESGPKEANMDIKISFRKEAILGSI